MRIKQRVCTRWRSIWHTDESECQRDDSGRKKTGCEDRRPILEEQKQSSESDTIEQLQKYKGLLDAGVITEEEFAAKKKQLLGI